MLQITVDMVTDGTMMKLSHGLRAHIQEACLNGRRHDFVLVERSRAINRDKHEPLCSMFRRSYGYLYLLINFHLVVEQEGVLLLATD